MCLGIEFGLAKWQFSVIFSALFCLTVGQCPDSSWLHLAETGMCYYVSPRDVTRQFNQSKSDCSARGGRLTSISNQAEWTLIDSQIIADREDYWIGLMRIPDSGRQYVGRRDNWMWLDDTLYDQQWNRWYDSPDGFSDEPSGEDVCGRIRADGYWGDLHCDRSFRFICKRRAFATTTTRATTTTTKKTTTTSTTTTTTTTTPSTTRKPTSVFPPFTPTRSTFRLTSYFQGLSTFRPSTRSPSQPPSSQSPGVEITTAPSPGTGEVVTGEEKGGDQLLIIGLSVLALQVLITGVVCLVVFIRRWRKRNPPEPKTGGFDDPSPVITPERSRRTKVRKVKDISPGGTVSYLSPIEVRKIVDGDGGEVDPISQNVNINSDANNKKSKKSEKKKLKKSEKKSEKKKKSNEDPEDGTYHDPDDLPFDETKIQNDELYMY